MAHFRKKPVVIEATQWFKNGDHPQDYAEDHHGFEGGQLRVFTGAERKAKAWEGDVVRYYRHPDDSGERLCQHCGIRIHEHGWIDTLEGGYNVCPGDWVITGVKGEFYPCKPDIFAVTYEPVGVAAAQAKPEPDPAGVIPDELFKLLDVFVPAHEKWMDEHDQTRWCGVYAQRATFAHIKRARELISRHQQAAKPKNSLLPENAPDVVRGEPAGWRLVPEEPTEAMIEAGRARTASWLDIKGSALTVSREKMRRRYAGMLAAAPTPPAPSGER